LGNDEGVYDWGNGGKAGSGGLEEGKNRTSEERLTRIGGKRLVQWVLSRTRRDKRLVE
jgi:hypothetical protein